MSSEQARRAAHDFGLRAEIAALALLTLKGYRILARRFAAHGGEVDLIVLRGGTIAFVEVKARLHIEAAQIAISEEKRRRISRAARAWMSRRPAAGGFALRGDAVFVAPWRVPKHLKAAFALDLDS
jgi:putative endonuclease